MIRLSLNQVFALAGYKPAPLPENTESAALSMVQAAALIDRFAAEDAAVFKFLQAFKASKEDTKENMSDGRMRHIFNFYQDKPHPKLDIELSKKTWLAVEAEEVSGLRKVTQFLRLTTLALQCRRMLQVASSPAKPEIIKILKKVSDQIDTYGSRFWKLSAAETQLIKNIMLPANPVDPAVADLQKLACMYAERFHARTGKSSVNKSQSPEDDSKFEIHRIKFKRYK